MGEAARVLDTYWDRFLAVEPLFATLVGDARFDDALPDQAENGRAERHRELGCLEHSPAAPPRSGRPTCGGWRRSRRPPADPDRNRLGGSGRLAQAPAPMGSRAGRAGASLERPCTPVERPTGNSRSHRSQEDP